MGWTIKLSKVAEKKYKKLDTVTKSGIKEVLKGLSEVENPKYGKDVKPLTGKLKGFYRLRVGDIRVIFAILPKERIIAVVNIAPRGDVYK